MEDLDLDSAKKKQHDVENKIQVTKGEIAELRKKIERLEAVKKKVSNSKKQAKEIKSDASKKNSTKKLGIAWKGQNYDDYVDSLNGEVKANFKNYINGIDNCLDSLVDKINDYENAILNKTTILSGLWTTLNDLTAWIEKTFN